MNRSILITGVAGSGKSAVCGELNKRGYRAYDIEDIPGLFAWYDKQTKKKATDHFEKNTENAGKYEWLCDVDKLKEMINDNSDGVVFYCGVGSNINATFPLFDEIFLLISSEGTLRYRLTNRTSKDYAKTSDVQDWIFSWKGRWEDSVKKYEPIIIDADKGLDEVVAEIVNVARQ